MSKNSSDFSLVALDTFIRATRDSGYKGTASAVSELVDNSLQAGATKIEIALTSMGGDDHPITLRVIDNGVGMDHQTLRTALRFGGSTRFNDRVGLGRYGMGLPNSSLSQAQRVTVHTWASADGQVLTSYLDLDEISSGELTEVPKPERVARPGFAHGLGSGTAVTWSRCDRLDARRVSTLERKLALSLGRRFRHFIWKGVLISINGERVQPVDPLFLHDDSLFNGATEFTFIEREFAVVPGDPTATGVVRVTFSELPVADWSKLSNVEKRERGIAKGAGVSVVRAGREVDYGWFFLGGKRRENYDDWWRCEISFEPALDEAFGITHTKQQIRPRPDLVEALSGDIENIARALNMRARRAHLNVKLTERFTPSEERAAARDELLKPLPRKPRPRDEEVLDSLKRELNRPQRTDNKRPTGAEYRIIAKSLTGTCFFTYARSDGGIVLTFDPEHPFYKVVYKRLLESDEPDDILIRSQIDLLILAAARAEALIEDEDATKVAEQHRADWSNHLATYLNP